MTEKKKPSVKVLEYYQDTFKEKPGKYVLYDLMREFNFLSPTYLRKKDIEDVLILEGQRSVVLYILKKLKTRVKDVEEEIDSYLEHNEYLYDMEE